MEDKRLNYVAVQSISIKYRTKISRETSEQALTWKLTVSSVEHVTFFCGTN